MKYFTRHLEENNISYFTHMKRSLGFAYQSFSAFLMFVIHAFFPFFLVDNGSKVIKDLNDYFHEEHKK